MAEIIKTEKCPFCGSEKLCMHHNPNRTYIECEECEARSPKAFGFSDSNFVMNEVIKAWNKISIIVQIHNIKTIKPEIWDELNERNKELNKKS